MSEWPDPQPEPGETAQRWVIGVLVIGAVLLIWTSRNHEGASWRMPEFSMPQISMPNISMPDFELRGTQEGPSATAPSASASITEALPPFAAGADAAPQPVPFETCVAMLADLPNGFGEAIIVEDTPERRVTRFKMLEGNLTLTCSAADNTLTIEQP